MPLTSRNVLVELVARAGIEPATFRFSVGRPNSTTYLPSWVRVNWSTGLTAVGVGRLDGRRTVVNRGFDSPKAPSCPPSRGGEAFLAGTHCSRSRSAVPHSLLATKYGFGP